MTKQITITIETGNAAFEDEDAQVSCILGRLASKIGSEGLSERPILDINGNKVGAVEIVSKV